MTRAFRPEGQVPGSVSSMMVPALSVTNAMRWPVSGISIGPPVSGTSSSSRSPERGIRQENRYHPRVRAACDT